MGESQDKFFVSHDGRELGPFSTSEIASRLTTGELQLTDYMYVERQADWVMILNVDEMASFMTHNHIEVAQNSDQTPDRNTVTTTQNTQQVAQPHDANNSQPGDASKARSHLESIEWYVLKGENKFGPFTYTDIVRMLQQKTLFEFDYVWHQGQVTWARIAEIDDFKPTRIKRYRDAMRMDVKEIFFRRRHNRIPYGSSIIIHDNKRVWKGIGIEISPGGAGIVMENAMILPGQNLFLHFQPAVDVPPFNAICEVVSKRYNKGVSHVSSPITYGVKFIRIGKQAQKFLNELANTKSKADSAA